MSAIKAKNECVRGEKSSVAVIGVGAVVVAATVYVASIVLPGAPVGPTCLAFALVWIVAAACYKMCSWRTAAGWLVLILATLVMAIGTVGNLHVFTPDGNLDFPQLLNWDAKDNWDLAMTHFGYPIDRYISPGRRGYALVIALLMMPTGPNLLIPLAFNVLCGLLTIIITGKIGASTAPAGRESLHATLCMGCMAAVCYFMAEATFLLKDAAVALGVAMLAAGLLDSRRPRAIAFSLIGVLLIAQLRPGMLPAVVFMATAFLWFKDTRAVAAVAMVTALALLPITWHYNTENVASIATSSSTAGIFWHENSHSAWEAITGDYTLLPWWQKLLWLPASLTVECITPFPWNFTRDLDMGLMQAYAHMTYPWYAILGLLLYYVIFELRRAPLKVSILLFWVAAMALILAYINAGTISRHCLPLLPAAMPAAAYVPAECRGRRLALFVLGYALAMAAGLTLCYHLQNG